MQTQVVTKGVSQGFRVSKMEDGSYQIARGRKTMIPLRESGNPIKNGDDVHHFLYACQCLTGRVVTGIVHVVETPKGWLTQEIKIF